MSSGYISPIYYPKALELFEAARAELVAQRFDASLVLAIHSAIAASDAVSIGIGTRRNRSSHERAAELLAEVGSHSGDYVGAGRRLTALLAQKTAIEYGNKRSTQRDAELAVRRGESLISWSREVLSKAKLLG